jgi:dienelactone hydrolase
MKIFYSLFFMFFVATSANAQIGNTTLTFQDPARNNRSIPCDVYYPSTSSGADSPITPGTYPVVAIGHGFVIGTSSYELIAEYLVPQGFVVALVNTEGGFSPNHAEFGLDLAFATHAIQAESNLISSLLFNCIDPSKEAIIGHSMGGGAAWLAANGDSSIDAIVGLAPAETNPSAIAAAANVQCPILVFSGSDDTVTPAADNHTPIFESSNSTCKFFVNLEGGSHCGFIPAGSLCDFGEPLGGSLSRANQQAAYLSLLSIWLRQVLKSECTEVEWQSNLLQYDFALANSNSFSCIPCLSVNESNSLSFSVYPNPVRDVLFIEGIPTSATKIKIFETGGACVGEFNTNGQNKIAINHELSNGVYAVEICGESGIRSGKKIVVVK